MNPQVAELVAHSTGILLNKVFLTSIKHCALTVMGQKENLGIVRTQSNIKPARGKFVQWLKANGKGHKSYYGGYDVWVGEFGQSMTRKEAYASAFTKVLREAGISAYAQSRMD